jgi:hypothetical protein
MLVIVAFSKIFLISLIVLECYGSGSLFRPVVNSIDSGSAVLAGQMDNTAMYRPAKEIGANIGKEIGVAAVEETFQDDPTMADMASEVPAGNKSPSAAGHLVKLFAVLGLILIAIFLVFIFHKVKKHWRMKSVEKEETQKQNDDA